ncbi:glycosyl hydrolase family 28-related protein [Oceanomicrobium pacificus]|uniref:Right-handed parallel beta-helix repeat-containing protein n=1 Tax=Oceanomicrobium pacificus TaxID=2692916 RepID=A0A6B0TJF9_9RHOB|nr:glycosyl hydrolase family 28-related protein [Oceanomicrobium pacificus]MXU64610.1 right-handed parallel beta-helix repeat-containing protein [Oceanomicrobium pacificus]
MNKAVTDGLDLMPPPFSAGLADWSRTDGTPGSPAYDMDLDAGLVAADADFGTCLELEKTDSVQGVRYKGEIPIAAGCYLRVSARLKVISGPLPAVRIGGWPGQSGGSMVGGIPQSGPSVQLDAYGKVFTVSALIGSGARGGVDMPWGVTPEYGHFGIDLTGANGGIIRIESIRVEDLTSVFHRDLMDWVDVRDYGALGDGVTDDSAAFLAADAAADGRTVLVPDGTFRLTQSVTMTAPVRFQGTISMPDAEVFSLTRNLDLATYVEAFDDETLALKKAFQALFNYSDHASLDLSGRRVQLSAPLDVHAAVGNVDNFNSRRALVNGQIEAVNGSGWTVGSTSSTGSYAVSNSYQITNVTNVANIEIGSLVTGQGVGREVYVTDKNVAAQTVTLSRRLHGAAGSQSYTFTRFRYLLDFSGFTRLTRFTIDGVEFACNGRASALMLPKDGIAWHIEHCWFAGVKDRGITSIGSGCNGMSVNHNEFLSDEMDVDVANRSSVALNTNSNDMKIRGNRAVRFRHFASILGGGHIIQGNHFWQNDASGTPDRTAGLLLHAVNSKTILSGNYIDNSWIEVNNEHDSTPNYGSNTESIGSLAITGNIFTANGAPNWFTFIRLAPYGTGHRIDGLTITGNAFKSLTTTIARVDDIDDSRGTVDVTLTRNLEMHSNSFSGVDTRSASPLRLNVTQTVAQTSWTVPSFGALPFLGRSRSAGAVTVVGILQTGGNQDRFLSPALELEAGAGGQDATLRWPEAVKGRALVELRCDLAR